MADLVHGQELIVLVLMKVLVEVTLCQDAHKIIQTAHRLIVTKLGVQANLAVQFLLPILVQVKAMSLVV